MTAVRSDTTRYGEAAMDPVPESPPRWRLAVPMACLVVRGASPSMAHHVEHDSESLSGAEQERILYFKKG